jgi:hypothetical protein
MPELVRRYVVMALATDAPFDREDPDAPFVLKPRKDPAALAALRAYRDHCYPELARELEAWIRAIESAAPVRGDIGRRNEPYAGGRTAAKAAAAPRAAKSRTTPAATGGRSRGRRAAASGRGGARAARARGKKRR